MHGSTQHQKGKVIDQLDMELSAIREAPIGRTEDKRHGRYWNFMHL